MINTDFKVAHSLRYFFYALWVLNTTCTYTDLSKLYLTLLKYIDKFIAPLYNMNSPE